MSLNNPIVYYYFHDASNFEEYFTLNYSQKSSLDLNKISNFEIDLENLNNSYYSKTNLTPMIVIFPIVKELLCNKKYLELMEKCTEYSSKDKIFRFYIYYIENDTFKSIQEYSVNNKNKEADKVIEKIEETINISYKNGTESLKEINNNLCDFLNCYRDLGEADKFQNQLFKIYSFIYPFSLLFDIFSFISIICLLSIIFFKVSYYQDQEFINLILSIGMGGFVATNFFLAITQKKFRFFIIILNFNVIWLIINSNFIDIDKNVIIGILLAFTFDYCRRTFLIITPIQFPKQNFFNQDDCIKKGISESNIFHIFNKLFKGEIFPYRQRIFLSYKRETLADSMAQAIKRILKENNIECFLDKEDIPLGCNWQFILEDNIRRCTTFIYFDREIFDQKIDTMKQMQFKELFAALIMKKRTSLPNVIFIIPYDHEYKQEKEKHIKKNLFHVIPLNEKDIVKLPQIIKASFPLYSGYGNPIWDIFIYLPIIASIKFALYLIYFIAFCCFYFYLPVLALFVKYIYPFSFQYVFFEDNVLIVLMFLCAGFSLRNFYLVSYETNYFNITYSNITNISSMILNILLPCFIIFNNFHEYHFNHFFTFICSLLLGFISLDKLIIDNMLFNKYGYLGHFNKINFRNVTNNIFRI